MWMKRCQMVTPSMAEASFISGAMVWRPARKMIISVPTLRHTAMMISDGIAQNVSFSQLGPSIPKTARNALITPLSCSRKRHTTATATIEVTTGR